MKRKILVLMIAVLFLFSSLPSTQASGLISFVGVNDSIPISLPANEAPYYSGGIIYAPYTAFHANPNGVGVSYNVSNDTLVLFTRSSRLIYDLKNETVTDETGMSRSAVFYFKNGMLFIPAQQAASHFGMSVSLLTSETGCQVIRFTNGEQAFSNQEFINKAETLIKFYLDFETKQSEGDLDPMNPDQTQELDQDEQKEKEPVTVFPVFAGEAVSTETLEYLKKIDVKAAFFLTQRQIMQDKELIRKIYAEGHSIGMTVETGEQDPETALAASNSAMDKVIFCKSILVLMPDLSWKSDEYRIISEQQLAMSVDSILMQEESIPRLLVCKENPIEKMERLLQSDAKFGQLLETTRFAY